MLLLFLLPPLLYTAGPPDRPRIELLTGASRPLVAGFHATGDPEPSFDARRVLFSGKRTAGDRWQVFEHDLATKSTRQITSGEHDARYPAYQSRFFTLDAPAPWDQVVFVRQSNLETCTLEGKNCHPITFHGSGESAGPPAVAWDGRVIYPLTANGKSRLFGVNLDGTDVALFSAGEVDRARAAPGKEEIYATRGGRLLALSLLHPSLAARQLAAAADPEALASGEVVAARGNSLVLLNPATGAERTIHQAAAPVRQPRALVRRTPPDGRGSVVNPADPAGVLYCLSARASGDRRAEKARYVRVHIEGRRPLVSELAPDGSFHLKLPANIPIRVETLDESRSPLLISGPFWVRNRENRGCIGCHENPDLTPENRLADALRARPIDLTGIAQ
jgi:hypothetical protein